MIPIHADEITLWKLTDGWPIYIQNGTSIYLHRNHVIDLYVHNALSHVMSNQGKSLRDLPRSYNIRMIYVQHRPSLFLHEASKGRRIKANRLFSLSLSLFLGKVFFVPACIEVTRLNARVVEAMHEEIDHQRYNNWRHPSLENHVSPATVWRPVWLTFVFEISWPGWFADCTCIQHTRTERRR